MWMCVCVQQWIRLNYLQYDECAAAVWLWLAVSQAYLVGEVFFVVSTTTTIFEMLLQKEVWAVVEEAAVRKKYRFAMWW